MASFTENLGLKKPDRTDRFSIEDFNGNMDIIDTIPDIADRALWVCQWEKRTEI